MDKSLYTREQRTLLRLLREIRVAAGLRQVQLAKLLDEPQSFISKYESGERRLDIIELRRICRALGTSLSKFAKRLEEKLGR